MCYDVDKVTDMYHIIMRNIWVAILVIYSNLVLDKLIVACKYLCNKYIFDCITGVINNSLNETYGQRTDT